MQPDLFGDALERNRLAVMVIDVNQDAAHGLAVLASSTQLPFFRQLRQRSGKLLIFLTLTLSVMILSPRRA